MSTEADDGTPAPARLIREKDIRHFAPWGRTQLAEKIKRGEFPAPIRLSASGRAKAWIEAEILQWQRDRIAARDLAKTAETDVETA